MVSAAIAGGDDVFVFKIDSSGKLTTTPAAGPAGQ